MGADVSAEPFASHPSVIIAAPGNALCLYDSIPAKALAGEAFIVREEGSGTRDLMERFFESAGLAPRIAMFSSSNETIKQAVMAGMGVALISRQTIGMELGSGMLRVLPVEGFPLLRSWFVVHRSSMPLLPIHAQLRNFLLLEGQRIIDRLELSYQARETARQHDL